MKVELHIDPSLSQPQAVIYAPANTPEVRSLVAVSYTHLTLPTKA